MYVIPELETNRFQNVEIPDGRTLFRQGICGLGLSYCPDQVAPVPISKIDAISQGDHLNRQELANEARAAAAAQAAAKKPGNSTEPADPATPAASAPAAE